MSETEFLVLRLYGPLAAWGDIAIGEIRPVLTHPTKSGIIGLLGAALGIKRTEEDTISAMSKSYGIAVCEEGKRQYIRDFHTVQQAPQKKEKIYGYAYLSNRQRELSIPKYNLETSLSYRDYICDVIYTVAIWVKDTSSVPYSLQELSFALQNPKFVLYLGRKSCVLSRPTEPQIIKADSPHESLKKGIFYGDCAKYYSDGKLSVYNYRNGKLDKTGQILYEGDWGETYLTDEIFRDEPQSRVFRQFSRRHVKKAPFCRSDS